MRAFFFIFLLPFSFYSFSQNSSSLKLMGHIENLPLKDGIAYRYESSGTGCPSDPSLIIFSATHNVYSITDGVIAGVFKTGEDEFAIVIKCPNNFFYTYFSLSSASVLKDDKVEVGTLLGMATNAVDSSKFQINLMMANRFGKPLNENIIWQNIRQSNAVDTSKIVHGHPKLIINQTPVLQ